MVLTFVSESNQAIWDRYPLGSDKKSWLKRKHGCCDIQPHLKEAVIKRIPLPWNGAHIIAFFFILPLQYCFQDYSGIAGRDRKDGSVFR
jgi:hypothetical protein